MKPLGDVAAIVRSKLAGVGHITLDILFATEAQYLAARGVLDRAAIAAAYGVDEETVSDFVAFDEGWAIKATLVRPEVAGGDGLGETDMYASGQFAPLLEVLVPEAAA